MQQMEYHPSGSPDGARYCKHQTQHRNPWHNTRQKGLNSTPDDTEDTLGRKVFINCIMLSLSNDAKYVYGNVLFKTCSLKNFPFD